MKRLLTLLTAVVLFASVLFAFGPGRLNAPAPGRWNYPMTSSQIQTQTQGQVQQQIRAVQTTTARYRNLQIPEDATISEVRTFKGTIRDISWDPNDGFRLTIQVDNDSYTVHAGPLFKQVSLKTGEEIEVKGRLVTSSSGKFILADSVTTGGKTIAFEELIQNRQANRFAQKRVACGWRR
uniref:DNA-binding protein n=1 Tax=Fervidobacterium thailandense TaxID=1008305 RepID=A0A7C4VSI0_9BACT